MVRSGEKSIKQLNQKEKLQFRMVGDHFKNVQSAAKMWIKASKDLAGYGVNARI
jgi:hypothetical protein